MSALRLHPHHASHGEHPVAVLGYLLLLVSFACVAACLVAVGTGTAAQVIVFGVVAGVAFVTGSVILNRMNRNLHHFPIIPDNTDADREAYRRGHPH